MIFLRLTRQGYFNINAFETFIKILPGDYREKLQIAFARNKHALKILGIDIYDVQTLKALFASSFRKKYNLHYALAVLFVLIEKRDLLSELLKNENV